MSPPNNAFSQFKEQRTVRLTTFKRDGTPVGTPVHIAVAGGKAYFRTPHKTWKVKRLRNNPRVEIAPSTFRGKATGAAVTGTARLLTGEEDRAARKAIGAKYRVLQGVLVPLAHRLLRQRTLHYEVVATD